MGEGGGPHNPLLNSILMEWGKGWKRERE